jgi:MFS family permease
MHTIELIAVTAVVVTAAVRSTWSPCGRSMLASITPLAERGRGHRYGITAAWFVVGATLGGATLGAAMAVLAAGVAAVSLGPTVVAAVAIGACVAAAASDERLAGFSLPVHHRQVNERWLDQFRPWAYGAGFGWQIGNGLSTYIMTAAVYLGIVLGALTAEPVLAVLLGALFGLVRGLGVLLGRRIASTTDLQAFHRRFDALEPAAQLGTVLVVVAAAAVFAWVLSPWAPLAVVATVLAASARRVAAVRVRRTEPVRPSAPRLGAETGA